MCRDRHRQMPAAVSIVRRVKSSCSGRDAERAYAAGSDEDIKTLRDFTRGPLLTHIARLALPVFMGMAFQMMYYLVDLYFVAKLGQASLAGLGIAGNVQFLVMAFTQVLGSGTTVLVARAIGG